MAAVLSVIVALLTGVFLVLVPWSPLWEANYLLQSYPGVRAFLLSGAVRGLVSALGVVNLLLALGDVHAHLSARGERL